MRNSVLIGPSHSERFFQVGTCGIDPTVMPVQEAMMIMGRDTLWRQLDGPVCQFLGFNMSTFPDQ